MQFISTYVIVNCKWIIFIITDSVSPLESIWYVGDIFLEKVYSVLQEMINTSMLNHNHTVSGSNCSPEDDDSTTKKLFLHDYFNNHHFADATSEVAIGRIINALIIGMNENHILPKFLLIIPDTDIIDDVNIYEFGAHKALATNLNWLSKQIEVTIRHKKMLNLENRAGTVSPEDTKVVYILMIKRLEHYPEESKMAKVCTLRSKFNELINEVAARTNSYVLSVRNCNKPKHFDHFGNLSSKGKRTF